MKTPNGRTAAALRDLLFDEIDALRAGKSDIGRAKALASLASTLIQAARLELDYAQMVAENPELANRQQLLLGSPAE